MDVLQVSIEHELMMTRRSSLIQTLFKFAISMISVVNLVA